MVQAGFELVIFRSQVHCLIRYSKLLVMNIGQKNLSCLCSMRKIVWQMKKIVLREIQIFEKYKFQLYLAHLFYNLTSKFLYCCSYWVYGYSQFDLYINRMKKISRLPPLIHLSSTFMNWRNQLMRIFVYCIFGLELVCFKTVWQPTYLLGGAI